MNTTNQRFGLLTMVILVTSVVSYAQPGYVITELGSLGGRTSRAAAINNHGQIVGYATNLREKGGAFLWEDGVMRELDGLPSGVRSGANAISEAAHVAGWIDTPDDTRPFLWHDGKVTVIEIWQDPVRGEAYGVNTRGQVVGYTEDEDGPDRAFVWEKGQLKELETLPGGFSTQALAINDSSQIVGRVYLSDLRSWHGVLWEGGRIRDLGTLPGGENQGSRAAAISPSGLVVGWSYNREGSQRAVLWEDGIIRDLSPRGSSGYAWGVNDSSEVVGSLGSIAFVFIRDAMIHLNEHLHPCSIMNTLKEARAINDSRQIVGNGYVEHYGGRRMQAYLLTPFSCSDVLGVKTRCDKKNGRLRATLSTSLPAGASLTLMNNFWGCKPVVIDGKGRAKVKWEVHPDIHAVCVAECWGLCGPSLECP